MELTDADREDISQRILTGLDQRRSIPEATHREHHAFVEAWIAREKRKEALREYAKKQAIGWGVFAVLSALGIGAYNWFEAMIKRVTGGGP